MQSSFWRSALSGSLIPTSRSQGSSQCGILSLLHYWTICIGTLVDELKNVTVLLYHNEKTIIHFVLKRKREISLVSVRPYRCEKIQGYTGMPMRCEVNCNKQSKWSQALAPAEFKLLWLHDHVYKQNKWFSYACVITFL